MSARNAYSPRLESFTISVQSDCRRAATLISSFYPFHDPRFSVTSDCLLVYYGFKYHTTAVGNKGSSIFYRIGKYFGRIAASLLRQLFQTARVQTGLRLTARIAVKAETAAAESAPFFRWYIRTAGRALSSQLRQIVDPRPKGTRDSRLPSHDGP